jgi:hypothetical protein
MVSKYIPVGQPYVAAIGSVMGEVVDLTHSLSLNNIINEVPSVFDVYKNAKFNSTLQTAINGTLNAITGLNFDNAKDKIPDIFNNLKDVKNIYNGLSEFYAQKKIPATEIEQLYEQYMANDEDLQTIKEAGKQLALKSTEVWKMIELQTEQLTSLPLQISKNVQDLVTVYSNLRTTAALADHQLMTFIADMSHQCEERLMYWQYVFIQSKLFRIGSPKGGNFQLNKIRDQIVKMVDDPNGGPLISPAQFEIISKIFDVQLNSDLKDIAQYLENKPKAWETESPLIFDETDPVIQDLNANFVSSIPLEETVFPSTVMETIQSMNISVDIGNYTQAEHARIDILQLTLTHSLTSTIRTIYGNTYLFNHGYQNVDSRNYWVYKYDLKNKTPLPMDIPSPSEKSLIMYLMSLDGQKPNEYVLHETPSLRAGLDLQLSRITLPPFPNLGIPEVKNIDLKLTYDYDKPIVPIYELRVYPYPEDFSPLIIVTPDINSMTSGYGTTSFLYPKGTLVTIQMDPLYCQGTTLSTRDSWTWSHYDGQYHLSTDPVLKLQLTDHTLVFGIYTNTTINP